MAGTRAEVEGVPSYRAYRAVALVAGDPNAMDQIDTSTLVDMALCWVKFLPQNAFYQYDQDSVAAADGFNVVAPSSGVGRWLLQFSQASQPFITQSTWYVDPVNGNDTNDGATALTALQTPGELAKRWSGRVFSPAIANVTVNYLAGAYTQPLVLNDCLFVVPTNVTIQGVMTQAYAGSLSGVQNVNPAGGLRGRVTDAAMPDFTVHAQRRLRMTAGAAIGECAFICPTPVGVVTQAYIGQFTSSALAQTNPGNDAYVIETFASSMPGCYINLNGLPNIVVRDLLFSQVGGSCTTRVQQGRGTSGGRAAFFGCAWGGTAVHVLEGAFNRGACAVLSTISQQFTNQALIAEYGAHYFGPAQVTNGSQIYSNHAVHDGNGTKAVTMIVGNNSIVKDTEERGFFGAINGFAGATYMMGVADDSAYISSFGLFWGSAANTTTNALRVDNGCGFRYATLPTATGAAPGSDVVLASGAAIAWGALPAIAAAPDNAYAIVRH